MIITLNNDNKEIGTIDFMEPLEHQKRIALYMGYFAEEKIFETDDYKFSNILADSHTLIDLNLVNKFLIENDMSPLSNKQFESGLRYFMVNKTRFNINGKIKDVYHMDLLVCLAKTFHEYETGYLFELYCIALYKNPTLSTLELFKTKELNDYVFEVAKKLEQS